MSNAETHTTHVEVTALSEYADLFPLPLAPLERFLVQDERPGYPMTFFVEMVFLGRVDRRALEGAVSEAGARHPLLVARVRPGKGGGAWVTAPGSGIVVDFQDGGQVYAPPHGADMDLRNESGVRLWVRDHAERTSMTFQFHHACCDGEGARMFVHDVLTGYARLVHGSETPDWTPVDYEGLRRRATFAAPTRQSAPASTTAWQKLRDAYHFNVLAPSPVAPGGPSPAGPGGRGQRPISIKHVFTREETRRIREGTSGSDVMLNDVAIALLFQTLARWNLDRGNAPGSQRLRILMPTDLRERSDRWLTATNRMSFSFLGRTVDQCREWPTLLEGVSKETEYIKSIRLGRDFVNIMAAVQRIPGVVPALQRLPRSMATAVLTNLGDTTRRFRRRFPVQDGCPVIGDLVLEHVVAAPPIRRFTRVGFGICRCAGYMALGLRCDHFVLDRGASRALLDGYVASWRQWAGL